MMPRLLGLGTAVPPLRLLQADAARMAIERCARSAREARMLETLHRRSGVVGRGVSILAPASARAPDEAGYERFYPADAAGAPTTARRMRAFAEAAPSLAARAARDALAAAAVDADRITHVVTVTCTGFMAPGIAHALQDALGLNPAVQRVDVGFMGCHAAVNGLQAAAALAAADPAARVLLVCVELGSLHFQYGWVPDRLVANALFADGAAAAVLGADAGGADAPGVRSTAARRIPDTLEAMRWVVGDHGFELTLSPRVPALVAAALRPWIDDWLATAGLAVSDVGGWAVHAGGPRIIEAVGARLGLAAEVLDPSRTVLREHGNMSSATVLFVLERLLAAGRTPCVLLAFGPGLAAEAALVG